ncbi:hypothetical protein HR51_28790 [Burkholderia cepacia]|nr:hypothetical protein HR51_28790 [Burkholderia cepacia]
MENPQAITPPLHPSGAIIDSTATLALVFSNAHSNLLPDHGRENAALKFNRLFGAARRVGRYVEPHLKDIGHKQAITFNSAITNGLWKSNLLQQEVRIFSSASSL